MYKFHVCDILFHPRCTHQYLHILNMIISTTHRVRFFGYSQQPVVLHKLCNITPRNRFIISNINWLTVTSNLVTILASEACNLFQNMLKGWNFSSKIKRLSKPGGKNPDFRPYFGTLYKPCFLFLNKEIHISI